MDPKRQNIKDRMQKESRHIYPIQLGSWNFQNEI